MPAFVRAKYQADNADIHPIRLKPETLAAAGAQPAGETTSSISADVRKGKRKFGLGPRGVVIALTVGTAPDTFSRYAFIPVLGAASFNNPPFVTGGTIDYKGASWTVVSLVPETVK